ncbi:MAG: DUF308 domain-containing protein [Patescibacteria group bacterium]|nr:DUF308 domain-containing protein [Patescibacteria group bacterium]
MESSIYLAEVFGWYLIIIGVIFIWKQKELKPTMHEIAGNRSLIFVVSILELLAGLFLVLKHNIWTSDYRIVITIIGWLALIEGAIYLIMSPKDTANWIKGFNKPSWYVGGGIVAIVIGIYLLLQVY